MVPSAHAKEILAHYATLDAALAKAGFPATSPWWRKQIRRFYQSGRRRWIIRVGRRGGKSSTLCRLAYVEARWGKHRVPPGDIGYVMFISKDRDEAAKRLRTIDAIANAVGDELEVRGEERLFVGRRTGFAVFTATIQGVSGPTAILVVGDETAKWRDVDTGANPATEVIASAMPTIAGQANARAIWSSSPFGTDDAHARMVDEGNTDHQIVSVAATWEARPELTEEQTHELEPDERVWQREYAAIPQAGALSAFDADLIDRAIAKARIVPVKAGIPTIVMDPSSGKGDSWTWCTCQWIETEAGVQFFRIGYVDGIDGKVWGITDADEIITRIAAFAKEHQIRDIHSDQRESYMISSAVRKRGLRFHEHPWTGESKIQAVARVRRWLSDEQLILPEHDKLRRQLVNLREKIAPSGVLTYGGRRWAHDDYASLILTAAMADIDRGVKPARPEPKPGEPTGCIVHVDRDSLTVGGGYSRYTVQDFHAGRTPPRIDLPVDSPLDSRWWGDVGNQYGVMSAPCDPIALRVLGVAA